MRNLLLLSAGLLAITSGCIQVDETLTIEKNGSGSLELLYTIPEQTVSQMKAMYSLKDRMDETLGQASPQTIEEAFERMFFDPTEDQIKRVLKKYEPLGVKTETLRVENRNSGRSVNLKVTFTSLEKISKADFFPEYGFTLLRNQNETYTFFRAAENTGTDPQGPGAKPQEPGLLSPIMSGFRVALKVTTPGKIIQTNASRKTLYNAAWIYDFEKDPNVLTTIQNQPMKIIFESKGLQIPEIRQTRQPAKPAKKK